MKANVISVSTVLDAIESMLLNDTAMEGITVSRSDLVPEDQTAIGNGWVGIYRTQQTLPVSSVGNGVGIRSQRPEVCLALLASHIDDGAECERRLEEIVAAVLSVVLSDPTLGGAVNSSFGDVSVRYDQREKTGTSYTQGALIFVTFDKRVTFSN